MWQVNWSESNWCNWSLVTVVSPDTGLEPEVTIALQLKDQLFKLATGQVVCFSPIPTGGLRVSAWQPLPEPYDPPIDLFTQEVKPLEEDYDDLMTESDLAFVRGYHGDL